MAATQGIYVPYLDFSSLENIDGWFSPKFYFVPRRSRLVSANPVSFLYTVNEHEDNRSFTIVNYNYFIFQKNENVKSCI